MVHRHKRLAVLKYVLALFCFEQVQTLKKVLEKLSTSKIKEKLRSRDSKSSVWDSLKMLTVKAGQAFQLVPVANELMNSYGNIISLVDSIIHLENEQSNIHIQPRFNNRMLIRLLLFFFKNYTFHKSTSEFCFVCFVFFFLRVECGRFLTFKPKQTLTCTLFFCQ